MKLLLAALALPLAAPLAAPALARPVAVAPNDADRLVDLLLPQAQVDKLAHKGFEKGMDKELAGDADLQKQMAANPGLKEFVVARLQTEFVTILKGELPALRASLSAIIAADMTPSEIGDTVTFFASPTGAKMIAQIYASMGENPDQQPDQMQQAAMSALMASLTPEDYPALMAFGASPAATRLKTVNPKISAASREWAEGMVARNKTRIETAAIAAAASFFAQQKNKKP